MSTGGTPLRAGVLPIEELPMASDRSLAYQIIRDAGPVVRDAHGAFLVTGASATDYVLRHPDLFSAARAPGSSVSAGWPAPLVGFDHLPLVFAARTHRAPESSQIASEQP